MSSFDEDKVLKVKVVDGLDGFFRNAGYVTAAVLSIAAGIHFFSKTKDITKSQLILRDAVTNKLDTLNINGTFNKEDGMISYKNSETNITTNYPISSIYKLSEHKMEVPKKRYSFDFSD